MTSKEKKEVIGTSAPDTVSPTEVVTPEKNRVTLVFKRPFILSEFNSYFYKKYGTVHEHRIRVIEELLLQFNETKKIEKEKPVFLDENRKLKEENLKLLSDVKQYRQQIATLTSLTQKVKEYDKLKEDNSNLQEEVKTQALTIDDLKEKLEKEEKNTVQIEKLTDNLTTETTNRIDELKTILQSKQDEIDNLTTNLTDYSTLKEENIRLSEELKTQTHTIDDMRKNIQKLETENTTLKQEHKQELTQTTETYEQRINKIYTNNNNTMNELLTTHSQELKEKDEEIKKLNGFVSSYAISFSNYVTKVESLGLFDRIRKNFPETDNRIKELKGG